MFDGAALPAVRQAIRDCTTDQRHLLDEIRSEVRGLTPHVRTIQPRTTTSISLVASDGGNNKLVFDPFYVQLVRVVDSYGKEHLLDAVAPTTDTDRLSERHWKPGTDPRTALGRLMRDLNAETLNKLSHMIPKGEALRDDPASVSPSWVQVYRDLCEWAVLYDRVCYANFATDTLLVRDGLLRSKLFRGERFKEMTDRMEAAIERIQKDERRKVFLVGLAKHSKVLDRYGLSLRLEKVFQGGDARFVRVPRSLEAKAYIWQEWARGSQDVRPAGEAAKFVAGDMFFVRFGPMITDPIWAVDLFTPQSGTAQEICGYLLADARDGFPIPYYPRCLQRADEYAQVRGFDLDILQTEVMAAVQDVVGDGARDALDAYRLTPDLTGRRYG
jgi:hypothetical protein